MQRSYSEPLRRVAHPEFASSHYADLILYDSEDDASLRRSRDNRREQPDGLQSMRCKYRGKACWNPRDVKIDGTLHTMCHQHRIIANENQRKAHSRKRNSQPRLHQPSIPPTPVLDGMGRRPWTFCSMDDLPQRDREENGSFTLSDVDELLTMVAKDNLDVEME
jgi:hypothetical protein